MRPTLPLPCFGRRLRQPTHRPRRVQGEGESDERHQPDAARPGQAQGARAGRQRHGGAARRCGRAEPARQRVCVRATGRRAHAGPALLAGRRRGGAVADRLGDEPVRSAGDGGAGRTGAHACERTRAKRHCHRPGGSRGSRRHGTDGPGSARRRQPCTRRRTRVGLGCHVRRKRRRDLQPDVQRAPVHRRAHRCRAHRRSHA